MPVISNAPLLIRNSFFNLLRGVIVLPLTVIITPYILSKTGIEIYGIYALLLALALQINLLDLGIATTLSKYIAQHYAKNDFEKINKTINNAFLLRIIVASLIIFFLIYFKFPIFRYFFKISPQFLSELNSAYMLFILASTFNLIFSIFISTLKGLQKMDVTNLTITFSSILNFILTLIFLELDLNLFGLSLAYAISTGVSAFISFWFTKNLLPSFTLSIKSLDLSEIRKLAKFGSQIQVTSFASMIHGNFDKFLISFFLGVNFTAFYDVASKVINILRNLAFALLEPILPAASEISTLKDKDKLLKLYYRSFKYLVFLCLPIFLSVSLWAKELILIWLGDGFELTIFALQLLALANFVNLLTGPAFLIFVGNGKVKYAAFGTLVAAFVNIILSTFLIIIMGFKGAVLGTTLALTLTGIGFIIFFLYHQKVNFLTYLYRPIYLPSFSAIISFFIVSFLRYKISFVSFNFLILAPLGIILYFIFIPYGKLLDEYDWQILKRSLRFLKRSD